MSLHAQQDLALFRGGAAQHGVVANGHFYWQEPSFREGTLEYGGRHYQGLMLNVDAENQRLLIKNEGTTAVSLPPDRISSFTIGERRFVNLCAMGYDAPQGFFEELASMPHGIYKQVRKVLLSSVGNHNGQDIGYDDPRYNERLMSYYGIECTYLLVNGGEAVQFRNASQLRKMTGVGKSSVRPEKDFDNYCRNVAAFMAGQDDGESLASPFSTSMFTPRPYAVPEVTFGSGLPSDYFSGKETAVASTSYEPATEATDDNDEDDYSELLQGAVLEVEVTSVHKSTGMGIEKFTSEEIFKLPVAFGEADVIRAVMSIPGVKSTGDAASGINVRGGTVDQNLMLFNGCTIYNPSHLFGIMSSFDADMINNVDLYKSSIPAEYGGRISSITDISGKDGNDQKFKGSIGLGLITSRLSLEGPIKKGRTSFALGGRTTYSNWMLKMLPEGSHYAGGKTFFADANATVKHKINDRNTLRAFVYWSADQFSFSTDTSFTYSNVGASLRWTSFFGNTRMDASAGYNAYTNNVTDSGNEQASYSIRTGVRQGFGKFVFKTDLGVSDRLSYGVDVNAYDINPGIMTPFHSSSIVQERALDAQRGLEGAAFAQNSWNPEGIFGIDAGLRYSLFLSADGGQSYCNPEYRLSLRFQPVEDFSVKAGFNSMTQNVHLVTNTSSISPMDRWVLSDSDIKPQTGWQAAAGLYWTPGDAGVELSAEGYWKRFSNFLDYKSGEELTMNPSLADALVPTRGKAYGVELLAKKSKGKFTGSLSYSYSRAFLQEMQDRGLETIAGGAWYIAPQDIPHDVKLIANYKFTRRFSLSANVNYATGRPITLPVGEYIYGGASRLWYSERNSYRMPDYFRMDIAMNIDPSHKIDKPMHTFITFGVYNLTGRRNAYSVYYSRNEFGAFSGHMLSVFACPIPYVNFNLLF